MMAVEGSTITSRIKNLLRSPSIKLRRSKAGNRREDLSSKAYGYVFWEWKNIKLVNREWGES